MVKDQPPASVSAGGGFGLTAEVTYANGVLDAGFHGKLTVSVSPTSNRGGAILDGTTTVAVDPNQHTATFSGLTLNNAGNGYVLQVSTPAPVFGNGPASTTTAAFNVTSGQSGGGGDGGEGVVQTAPTIVAEQLTAFYARHNKKGKPVAEVLLTFGTSMSTGTIDNAGSYQVAWESFNTVRTRVRVGKRIKTVSSRVAVFHPVPAQFQAADSSAAVVALVTSVPMQKFAKGGQVTIVSPGSILSAAGVSLGGATTFTI